MSAQTLFPSVPWLILFDPFENPSSGAFVSDDALASFADSTAKRKAHRL
jgi:hypothetical protein